MKSNALKRLFLSGFLLFWFAGSSSAINLVDPDSSATQKTLPKTTDSTEASQTKEPVPPKVVDAYSFGHNSPGDKSRNEAGINDVIVVKVHGLQDLVNKSKCLDKNGKKDPACIPQRILLYLDGRQIEGIAPESGAPSPDEETLRFRLERTVGTNDKIWADLLGAPKIGKHFFKRTTEVSVGLENEFPVPTEVKGDKVFKIVRIRSSWFWCCTIAIVFLLYYLYRLATESDILRDSGPALATSGGAVTSKPYSLARCQMAFWFFWVVTSFLYIWLATGAYDIITTEALALIGIGTATALGASTIDAGKDQEVLSRKKTLTDEEAVLNSDIASLAAQMQTGTTPAITQTYNAALTRLTLVQSQLQDITKSMGPKSSAGWLTDVLSDSTGVSFHRFQIVVWTCILGLLFIFSVWNRLSMPEFGATLLALQGISAATYIGFKIPEK